MCPPLHKIRGLSADEILKEYYHDGTFPLDLGVLLENIGISNDTMDFTELEKITGKTVLGLVVSDSKNAIIYYREDDTPNRQRFTIAHELAHCCLYNNSTPYRHIEFRMDDEEYKANLKEIKANIFAGELLIPFNKLKEVYLSLDKPYSTILAKKFGVSTSVMEARLNYLGISYLNREGMPIING